MQRTECAYCKASLVNTSTPLPDPPPNYIHDAPTSAPPGQPNKPLSTRRVTGFLIMTLAAMYPVIASYFAEDGHMPMDLEWTLLAAIVSTISIAFLWGHQRHKLSTILLFAVGAGLFLKPLIVPYRILDESVKPSQWITFGFDSETHMFFWVPGGLLLLVPFFWFFFVRSPEDSDN